jgi:hypothetical protein
MKREREEEWMESEGEVKKTEVGKLISGHKQAKENHPPVSFLLCSLILTTRKQEGKKSREGGKAA